MVLKLCVRSLQRGVGSPDFIHSLLIMEDEESDTSIEHFTVYSETPLTDSQQSSEVAAPNPGPPSTPSNSLSWCKRGVCIVMPQQIVVKEDA